MSYICCSWCNRKLINNINFVAAGDIIIFCTAQKILSKWNCATVMLIDNRSNDNVNIMIYYTIASSKNRKKIKWLIILKKWNICMRIGEGNDLFLGGHSFVVVFIQGWISTSSSEGKTNNKTVVCAEKIFLRFLICMRQKTIFFYFNICILLTFYSSSTRIRMKN